MGKKVRSMRGEVVDFDLQQIKSQIQSAPAPHTVRAREDFIDQKLRRRVRKVKHGLDAARERQQLDSTNIADEPSAQEEFVDEAPESTTDTEQEEVEAESTSTSRPVRRRKPTKKDDTDNDDSK